MPNVVEAVLRSKYEDGVDQGVENTRALMEKTFSSMKDASAAAAAGINTAFESAAAGLEGWRTNLAKAADDSDNQFKRMGLGAVALGVAFAEVFLRAAKAAADFVIEITKEASEVAAARFSFEHLTAAQGENADMMLGKLKVATEGQIGQLSLLRNANKVMQGELPLTSEQYLQLTENVARLAKSAGTDAVAAQDALTTALVRGMSRGLGPAIGLHLAVKDAVTSMAEEMGTSAAALPDHSKLQAFYNDLLEKTGKAVDTLGPKFVTLEEALTHAKTTWRDWLDDMGTAITRSGVFQGLLVVVAEKLNGVNTSMDQQHRVALAVNDALIEMLRIFASVMEGVGKLITVFEFAHAVALAVGAAIAEFFLTLANLIVGTVDMISHALAFISGDSKHALDPILAKLDEFAAKIQSAGKATHDIFEHSFDGVGGAAAKAQKMSDAANKLSADMEKLRGVVLDGAAGTKEHTKAVDKDIDKLKELNEQLTKYRELLFSLNQAVATPEQKLMNELTKEVEEIGKLDKISAEQRNDLYAAAWAKYDAEEQKRLDAENARQKAASDAAFAAKEQAAQKLLDLDTKFFLETANEEQKAYTKREQDLRVAIAATVAGSEERTRLLMLVEKAYDAEMDKIQQAREAKRLAAQKKEIEDALSAANAIIHAVEAAAKGTLSQADATAMLGKLPQVIDVLKRKLAELHSQPIVSDQQIAEIEKLQSALNQLNKINLTGFKQILQQLKDQMQQMGQQITLAWGQMWSDLALGQENAGKKFLGSLLQMAGQQLEMLAITQTAKAIAAAADLDFAGAVRHGAAAAALGALGGIISGLGSALGNSGGNTSASSSAAAPSASASQQSANPQTLSVGAPGSGRPANAQQTQHIIQLEIKPSDAYIVKTVQSNIAGNGVLRTVVKK